MIKILSLLGTMILATTTSVKAVTYKENTMVNNLTVRQIGDKILENPPKLAEFNDPSKMQSQINTLLDEQKKYGGVGISANQCLQILEPMKISIIGTNDPETRKHAAERYPGEKIPFTSIAINLVVSNYHKIYFPQFGEGCLSVQGPIRAKVERYETIDVKYQTPNQTWINKTVSGFEAHIFQHEYDHLQGVVFLEKIFKDCTKRQIKEIKSLLNFEIAKSTIKKAVANTKTSLKLLPIIFDRDKEGKIIYDVNLLKQAFLETPNITLLGIKKILNNKT